MRPTVHPKLVSRGFVVLLTLVLLGEGASSRALAQHGYPSGSIPTVPPTALQAILSALDEGRPVDALKHYFGAAVYDSLRPAWVIYLDGVNARQWLVQSNRIVDSRVLNGEKNLFVRIFARGVTDTVWATTNPTVDTVRKVRHTAQSTHGGVRTIINADTIMTVEGTSTAPQRVVHRPVVDSIIHLARSTLDYKADPALIRLIVAAGSLLKINPGGNTNDTPAPGATIEPLRLVNVGRTVPFYAAWARVPLSENVQYQLALAPEPGQSFGTDQVVITNIGNVSRSRFGAALGGGLTFQGDVRGSADDTAAREHGERINLYVFGQWFLRPPELPWKKNSRALVIGTNVLEGNLFDDIVLGHSWGRHVGAVGFVLGINLIEGFGRDGSETRFVRPFFGLDYLF